MNAGNILGSFRRADGPSIGRDTSIASAAIRRALRALEAIALGACILSAYFAGDWWARWSNRTIVPRLSSRFKPPLYNPVPGFPADDLSGRLAPAEDSDRIASLRKTAVRHSAEAIRGQCQAAADGNWDRWQEMTAPFRAQLHEKLVTLPSTDTKCSLLEGCDGFPLSEFQAPSNLDYLCDSESLAGFRSDRAVTAAHRWLRRRGIDLVFVAVPKMTEVYIEHFVDPCPADGIVAPHVRRTLLELLDDDVEVVDGLTPFRPLRAPSPDYLYNTCDSHWAPRGIRVMAKEIADRLERYPSVAAARFALPVFTALPGPYNLDGSLGGLGPTAGFTSISRRQQARARVAQTTVEPVVRSLDGQPVFDDPASPVLVIGHSYVDHFAEQLVREMNLRIRRLTGGGNTTEAFADFLREPEHLDGVRVVVWITTEQHMTHFKPMPPPILAALGGKR
jgi:hypothetical protein